MIAFSRITGFLRAALGRAWLAFCRLAVIVTIAAWIADGDHLLRSDDPYLVGFLFGGVAACFALIYSIAEFIRKDGWFKHAVCLAVYLTWCVLLVVMDCYAIEGRGLASAVAAVSLVPVAIEWWLLQRRMPRAAIAVLSVAGAMLLGLYLYVALGVLAR